MTMLRMARGFANLSREHLRAAAHDGVVTARALVALGVPESTVYHRCRDGGPWQRLAPGIILMTTGHPTTGQLVTAALLHGGGTPSSPAWRHADDMVSDAAQLHSHRSTSLFPTTGRSGARHISRSSAAAACLQPLFEAGYPSPRCRAQSSMPPAASARRAGDHRVDRRSSAARALHGGTSRNREPGSTRWLLHGRSTRWRGTSTRSTTNASRSGRRASSPRACPCCRPSRHGCTPTAVRFSTSCARHTSTPPLGPGPRYLRPVRADPRFAAGWPCSNPIAVRPPCCNPRAHPVHAHPAVPGRRVLIRPRPRSPAPSRRTARAPAGRR